VNNKKKKKSSRWGTSSEKKKSNNDNSWWPYLTIFDFEGELYGQAMSQNQKNIVQKYFINTFQTSLIS